MNSAKKSAFDDDEIQLKAFEHTGLVTPNHHRKKNSRNLSSSATHFAGLMSHRSTFNRGSLTERPQFLPMAQLPTPEDHKTLQEGYNSVAELMNALEQNFL